MLLAKMEDYRSILPPLCIEDAFTLSNSFGDGLCGRKRKKKPDMVIAEFRLDSPCASPEVIMSGGIDDGSKGSTDLLRSDSFTDAQDSIDHGSMFGSVDMEGFCEINATMTAGEDIMLSSSAKENKMVLKEEVDVHNVSHSVSSISNSSGLQSAFESDVDALLDICLWQNKQDLLPDLSGLAVSGYLLSDIPSHPDLSCEAVESADSLMSYCSVKDECLSNPSAVPLTVHNKEQLLTSIKNEEDDSSEHQHDEDVYSDFEALCTSTLLDDRQAKLSDCSTVSGCRCPGRDCSCYKSSSETSSADEEDVCIEYIVSNLPSKVKKPRARRPALVRRVRRGPGRPRKSQNTEFVRRGPGRPRKNPVSDAVVWYQTRRKRTVSLSNGCKSRSRHKSVSEARDAQSSAYRAQVQDDAVVKPKRSHKGETLMQLNSDDSQRTPSLHSVETGISITLFCNHIGCIAGLTCLSLTVCPILACNLKT